MKQWAMFVFVVPLLLVAAFPGAALAAPPDVGTFVRYVGPASSNGAAAWNAGTAKLTLAAESFSTAAGYCESVYFDWEVLYGHYDPHAARDCTSSGYDARYNWSDSTFWVDGVNRLGACYEPNNTNTNNCSNYPGTTTINVPKNFTTASGVYCISWIQRYAWGSLQFNGGGDKRSCTS